MLVFAGVVVGLVIGKPLGICIASLTAVKLGAARTPDDVGTIQFVGAACLCGIGDTVALLMADQAFPAGTYANIAKLSVLVGSLLAALLGYSVLALAAPAKEHS